MQPIQAFLLTILVAALAACNGSNAQPQPAANVAPAVVVIGPLVNTIVEAGATVEIRYTDDDPDTVAVTDVVAVSIRTFREVAIAVAVPEGDGVEQTVMWDTTGVEADTYEIEVRSDDGETETVATAPGSVTVTAPVVTAASGAWAERATVADSAVLPDGSLIVVGAFGGDVTLGEDQAGETTLSATGTISFFIARYQADGTLLWARHATSAVVGTEGLCVDAFPDGSCAVIGHFGGETTFSPGRADEQVLAASPFLRDNAFVARYDADGALLWIDAIRNEDNLVGSLLHVAASADGCVFVTGLYNRKPVSFNVGRPTEAAVNDAFVYGAKYDATGSVVWARNLVSTGRAGLTGIAAFDNGSFVVCGGYDNTDIVLGQGEANETLLADEGDQALLARFNGDGTLDWATRMSAAASNFFFSEAVTTPSGAVMVSGFHRDGGDVSVGDTTIGMIGVIGGFLARFEGDGTFSWLTQMQNAFVDEHGLGCAADGSCVMSVHFQQDLTIAPGTSDELVLPDVASAPSARMLATVRFAADGTLLWARADGPEGTLGENAAGAHVLPDGKPLVVGGFLDPITIGSDTLRVDFSGFFVAIFEEDGVAR